MLTGDGVLGGAAGVYDAKTRRKHRGAKQDAKSRVDVCRSFTFPYKLVQSRAPPYVHIQLTAAGVRSVFLQRAANA